MKTEWILSSTPFLRKMQDNFITILKSMSLEKKVLFFFLFFFSISFLSFLSFSFLFQIMNNNSKLSYHKCTWQKDRNTKINHKRSQSNFWWPFPEAIWGCRLYCYLQQVSHDFYWRYSTFGILTKQRSKKIHYIYWCRLWN